MRAKYLSLFYFWMLLQSLLHFLLMLGLPLGRLVFGGAFVVFPLWLRPVNFFAVLIVGFL